MKEGKEMDWFVFYVWNDAVIVNWVFLFTTGGGMCQEGLESRSLDSTLTYR